MVVTAQHILFHEDGKNSTHDYQFYAVAVGCRRVRDAREQVREIAFSTRLCSRCAECPMHIGKKPCPLHADGYRNMSDAAGPEGAGGTDATR